MGPFPPPVRSYVFGMTSNPPMLVHNERGLCTLGFVVEIEDGLGVRGFGGCPTSDAIFPASDIRLRVRDA